MANEDFKVLQDITSLIKQHKIRTYSQLFDFICQYDGGDEKNVLVESVVSNREFFESYLNGEAQHDDTEDAKAAESNPFWAK